VRIAMGAMANVRADPSAMSDEHHATIAPP
jgi:hypothetical protein